jgi:ubiquinone/menaquinone biosynthesis C-methylase UbiE
LERNPNPLVALYDELAADYERTRVPRFRPFVKKLLQLYDTRPASVVLDAGCGTGLAATMVAPRVGHSGKILGVDGSSYMLDIARRKAQGFGFTQCEFVKGDLTKLNVNDETFDLVICSFALWGEPTALFREFFRVLKPHGALLLQNWEPDRNGVERTYREALNSFMTRTPNAELTEVRRIFAEQSQLWKDLKEPQAYEDELTASGFRTAFGQWITNPVRFANVAELIEYYDLGVRARGELEAMDVDTRARFTKAVTDALRPLETAQGVQTEWRAIQALARK